jgi:hypothetical protein
MDMKKTAYTLFLAHPVFLERAGGLCLHIDLYFLFRSTAYAYGHGVHWREMHHAWDWG